ncbi:protein kinase [Pyxidicoccus fallax]|uniref:non-specific serine/threonine protein kinase n=1 Tax=Pyxidicoccus fallax TaxID=394095 RepID=A0A848LGG5_9BACT|nr:serine/threonine-protein kinase [Pyxidicoccus fallax]NMO16375.1 protein kinase [Pyxidicoccus fallax]NPC78179.1 protein kinase [Pyxidicoccus fallax]
MVTHPLALQPGMSVGPWRILAQLGSGSFGIVFQVEHEGRLHALKFALRSPGSEDLDHTDARSMKELACLLQAAHPNVVRVWAHGRWPDARTGHHYVVMDFVEGTTLADWVKQARPSARRVARLFSRLARTLGELHARDVFHRDLKPSNILVRAVDEEPILVDFGSADHAEAPPLTESALPPGTPHYRTPEALRFHREHHARPDARYPFRATDDLYALGVTLYEVLAGVPAFSPSLPRELLVEHIEERLPPLPSSLNPRIPAPLEAIVLRLLQKRARDRFPHGEALHSAFEDALRAADPEWDVPLFSPEPTKEPASSTRRTPSDISSRALHVGPLAPPASAQARRPAPASHLSASPASSPPRSRRLASWHLLGAAVLLGLLAVLSPYEALQARATPPPAIASLQVKGVTEAQPPIPTSGMEGEALEEETVMNPMTPGTPKWKRSLPTCLAGLAAATSLHCASTPPPYATPMAEQPRRDQPCSPVALSSMKTALREYGEPAELPLVGTVQLDYLQDFVHGDSLEGGLRTGVITSITRDDRAFPSNTLLHGWVWVDGDEAEIQWHEASIPGRGDIPGSRISICARVGNLKRRKVLHSEESTPKKPVWVRTDHYVLVERW